MMHSNELVLCWMSCLGFVMDRTGKCSKPSDNKDLLSL